MTWHVFRTIVSKLRNKQGWHPNLIEWQIAHAERSSACNRSTANCPMSQDYRRGQITRINRQIHLVCIRLSTSLGRRRLTFSRCCCWSCRGSCAVLQLRCCHFPIDVMARCCFPLLWPNACCIVVFHLVPSINGSSVVKANAAQGDVKLQFGKLKKMPKKLNKCKNTSSIHSPTMASRNC